MSTIKLPSSVNVVPLDEYREVWAQGHLVCPHCLVTYPAIWNVGFDEVGCHNCGGLVPVPRKRMDEGALVSYRSGVLTPKLVKR